MKIKFTNHEEFNDMIKESYLLVHKDIELSLEYANKAYEHASVHQDKLSMSKANLQMGIINIIRDEYDRANEHLEESIDYYEWTRDNKVKYVSLLYLGDLRYRVNDYDSALEYYLECLNLLSDHQQWLFEKCRVLYRLGQIYIALDYSDIAIEYFQEIHEILTCQQVDWNAIDLTRLKYDVDYDLSNEEIRYLYALLAECYMHIGDLSKCEEYIKVAINKAVEENDDDELAYAFFVYGKYYANSGQIDESRIYYNRAIRKFHRLNNRELLIGVMIQYGIMLYHQGAFEEAMESLMQSHKLFDRRISYKLNLEVNLYLAKIFEEYEDYEQAYYYYKRYSELKTVNDETWKTIKAKSVINKYEKLRSDIKLKELETINTELENLYNLGNKITSSISKKEIIGTTYDGILKVIPFRTMGIGLLNNKGKLDYILRDYEKSYKSSITIKPKHEILADMFKEGKEILINHFDAMSIQKEYGKITGFDDNMVGSLISCPLLIRNDLIGLLVLTHEEFDAYNRHDLDVLRIMASYVATAMYNFQKSQEILNKNKRLRELTEKDGLTKVFNRYSLNVNIDKIVKQANRYNNPFSVLMIDVDYFKQYNDNYGHLKGDECLKIIANALVEGFKGMKNYVYRFGGDEFLVLVLNENKVDVENRVQVIMDEVKRLNIEHHYSKHYNHITLSIGIATFNKVRGDYNESLLLADKALYKAKDLGRNTYYHIVEGE